MVIDNCFETFDAVMLFLFVPRNSFGTTLLAVKCNTSALIVVCDSIRSLKDGLTPLLRALHLDLIALSLKVKHQLFI